MRVFYCREKEKSEKKKGPKKLPKVLQKMGVHKSGPSKSTKTASAKSRRPWLALKV